jgi:hypothetical protein
MASKYRVHDANATGIGRSISYKKKGKGIFVSNAIRKHKVMSINQYRYVLKVVSVFTLVPLKTLKFGTMRNILNVR